ncbi:hypothetical protein [Actinomyces qiguomingii]|uniref:hypothetical protein n=1 Tax=Actinomyces qiguomingii TaxID=2057800 RepID=UPI000CA026E1|nr:hypothetical protein [Actinomyces qiguomingii]
MRPAELWFYIDENIADGVHKTLASVYRVHRFRTPKDEGLTGGVKDIQLFHDLALRGFDAIITMDGRQLENQDERDALAANNLHWIGFNMPTTRGADAIARQSATILAGMPYVLDHWANKPTAYHLPDLPGTPPDIEPL